MLIKLSFLHMWREKHNTEFKIMAAALFLAVFAITTLLVLSQVLRQSIIGDASTMLGADLILESSDVIPDDYQQYAYQQNIQTATVVDFFSMMQAKDSAQLTAVSAISGDQFPLRGQVKIKEKNQSITKHGPPPSGHIWLEESLALKLNVHENEEVTIGDASFIIDGLLGQRPMALSDSTVLAPVAYVNAEDLAKMAVLQPGSRATYRLLLSGSDIQLTAFKNYFTQSSNITWITATEGRPAINRMIMYSQRYLAVILLIQVILAGTAIALCAHQYSLRQQRNMALWKSFGASNKTIVGLQFLSLSLLSFIVLALAIATGYGVAIVLLQLSDYSYALSQINWQGAQYGGGTGLLILIGFALGPLWELREVSTLQLLQRRELKGRLSFLTAILAVFCLMLLFYFFLQEPEVALRLGMQIAGLSTLIFAIGYVVWQGFGLVSQYGSIPWRFGMSYMVRHKSSSITQWFVFMLVIMMLLLVQIIQKDFISSWKAQLSNTTPNYFMLNIQSSQLDELQKWFIDNRIHDVHFYPIVRGRMSSINGISLEEINKDEKEKKGLQRSINLTWMKSLPKDNHVEQGVEWEKVREGELAISIEKRFAQRQSLKLGDSLGFSIADKEVSAKIVQIRTVQWESFKPNFFVIFPPKVLDDFPHSYITSVYLPASQKDSLISLTKKYVEISVIDIDALLTKAREVIDKIASAVQLLLMLVFIFGVFIMYASILSSLKERLKEGAMLQILGANKKFVLKVLLIEFGVLGSLAGLAGSVTAYFIAQDLAHRFFDLSLTINTGWFLWCMLGSVIAVVIFGLVGARKVFQVSPLWLLRQTA